MDLEDFVDDDEDGDEPLEAVDEEEMDDISDDVDKGDVGLDRLWLLVIIGAMDAQPSGKLFCR